MSDWELIDFDPGTGLRKWMRYEEESDSILVRYDHERKAQDAILDANKAAQAERWDRRGEMWHAAHIPIGVIYEWLTKHGVDFYDPNHKPAVMRLLNSSDYRYLRVREFVL